MEYVNRTKVCLAIHEQLVEEKRKGLSSSKIDNVIACSAEAYSFPSNLDVDHPSPDYVAPRTQASYMTQAVMDEWPKEQLEKELTDLHNRRE